MVLVLSVAAGKCFLGGYLGSGIHWLDMWRNGNSAMLEEGRGKREEGGGM
jgi:hypothetical protein